MPIDSPVAGYRMMNLASRMEGSPFTEIQSSMSKFNHFGQKAGFRFVGKIDEDCYRDGRWWSQLRYELTFNEWSDVTSTLRFTRPGRT